MWVDRDDRTSKEKARHDRIVRQLDQDTKRIQEKLKRAYEKAKKGR